MQAVRREDGRSDRTAIAACPVCKRNVDVKGRTVMFHFDTRKFRHFHGYQAGLHWVRACTCEGVNRVLPERMPSRDLSDVIQDGVQYNLQWLLGEN